MKANSEILAAVIFEGDYFVIQNGEHGTSVSYSPEYKAGAHVIGAFGSRLGVLHYLTGPEAQAKLAAGMSPDDLETEIFEIMENTYLREKNTVALPDSSPGGVVEEMVLQRRNRMSKLEEVYQNVKMALVQFAIHSPDKTFTGSFGALLSEIQANVPSNCRSAVIRRLKRKVPGFSVTGNLGPGPNKGVQVDIDLERVSSVSLGVKMQ